MDKLKRTHDSCADDINDRLYPQRKHRGVFYFLEKDGKWASGYLFDEKLTQDPMNAIASRSKEALEADLALLNSKGQYLGFVITEHLFE